MWSYYTNIYIYTLILLHIYDINRYVRFSMDILKTIMLIKNTRGNNHQEYILYSIQSYVDFNAFVSNNTNILYLFV